MSGPKGLHQKFVVVRTDGQSAEGGKHEHCRHFVLDLTHDMDARFALRQYADRVRLTKTELYGDLHRLLTDLEPL